MEASGATQGPVQGRGQGARKRARSSRGAGRPSSLPRPWSRCQVHRRGHEAAPGCPSRNRCDLHRRDTQGRTVWTYLAGACRSASCQERRSAGRREDLQGGLYATCGDQRGRHDCGLVQDAVRCDAEVCKPYLQRGGCGQQSAVRHHEQAACDDRVGMTIV